MKWQYEFRISLTENLHGLEFHEYIYDDIIYTSFDYLYLKKRDETWINAKLCP